MKLELADFPVKDVQFSRQTSYNKGVLEIDKEELVTLVLEDKRIASADLDVAFPGEQTRITFVRDVVEPRVKVSGPGAVFPGILGPKETVGEGRTHRLSGVTVVASAQSGATITTRQAAESRGMVDMWGPGAQVTPYGSLINVVLVLKLIDSVSELEANSSTQLAEFKVARRLAETTRHSTPEIVETFELFEVEPSLPRVVYNICFHTDPPKPRISLYGFPIREGLPIILHPNEFLDAAVTSDAQESRISMWQCWSWMNNPTILGLLREHGKRLNFLGVILQRSSFYSEVDKQATATFTSQVARLLRADGAIITGIPFIGNTFFGVMLTVQAYERKGIKTVLLTPEASGSGGGGLPLVFHLPEANAIVSTGDLQRKLELPAPAKVIGCEKGQLMAETPEDVLFSPWGELKFDGYSSGIEGGIDTWGGMNYTCKEY